MEVLREIRRQAGRRGRARDGLYGKVVGMRLLHGQVFEIEAIGTKAVHSPKRPTTGTGCVRTKAVPKEHGGRLHRSEGRRMLHGDQTASRRRHKERETSVALATSQLVVAGISKRRSEAENSSPAELLPDDMQKTQELVVHYKGQGPVMQNLLCLSFFTLLFPIV